MHSISESDRILSDPYEVLCCMGTLIIEGRVPKAISDSGGSGETATKSSKPYSEGPHCPKNIKTLSQDAHKCTDNNILCIRYNNLRQHLQYLHTVSPSITIEVSLGPDCLCGELRSQSTLVSTQPSKRDAVLEQWTITTRPKQGQEASSQMSVVSVYQAVRSLLHFSQLTAWYMSTDGAKPSHVIYRVVIPEDAAYIADSDFVSHDLPMVDINKKISLKISLKTLPRKEKIPTVFCPQHSSTSVESTSGGSSFEEQSNEKGNSKPKSSSFCSDGQSEALPLKFHGVRKKTNEAQERKRKKHITLYSSPSGLTLDGCSGSEILDGIDVKKVSTQEESDVLSNKRTFPGGSLKPFMGESSKADIKKSKPSTFLPGFSTLVEPHKSFDAFSTNFFEHKLVDPTLDLMLGLNSLSESKKKSDFRTKGKSKMTAVEGPCDTLKEFENKSAMDILDDRMQISCAISGKHHCKWECDEDSDLNAPGGNVEKPKRRRSLSRARVGDGLDDVTVAAALDSEKILHGKFKDVMESFKEDSCATLEETEAENACSSTCGQRPDISESPGLPQTVVVVAEAGNAGTSDAPAVNSLPLVKGTEPGDKPTTQESAGKANGSSRTDEKEMPSRLSWVRKESFESFKRGCDVASFVRPDYSSGSEDELSDGQLETSNPFLAAILRTTKKAKSRPAPKSQNKCDSSSVENNFFRGEKSSTTNKSENPFMTYLNHKNVVKLKAKAEEASNRARPGTWCGAKKGNLDLRLAVKKPAAVKGPAELFGEDASYESSRCDFITENLQIPFDEKTLDPGCLSNNGNSTCTKTIPVPSAHDKLKFRRSLDSAAQLVFHRCSGLPLTSSPAPVRRNNSSFSFDSSLNSVSAIKSALFESGNSLSSEDENESEGSLKSPASPGAWPVVTKQINYHSLSPLPLLGSFEESVLNGRLEPVSTVQGFTAELGASGSFCPRHLHLPVTVFFYTLGDNDKVSAPYLGHINLGKKGYNVPRSGTIQVTLFNPLRTVVKMFVVVYDLSDMPANSHTFLRQRTLYVPTSQKESTYMDRKETPFDQDDYHKYLRYLIHLRFVSGKSGRIYLHTDIRMVIFRKADEDTATALGKQIDGETYELRSHTHGPINPKFSPRK